MTDIRTGFDYDLGYTCFLISEIAFMTNNKLRDVIGYFSYKDISNIYNNAPVFHCEDSESVSEKFISFLDVKDGKFKHSEVLTSIELGDILGRLIYDLYQEGVIDDKVKGILDVFNSDFIEVIENVDAGLYWQSAEVIYDYYLTGNLDWLEM